MIEDPVQLSRLILDELGAFQTIYHAEAHHDLIGHMLTYGHALNILYELGYPALFHKGIPPFLTMVKALRLSRDVDIEQEMPSLQSPVDLLPLERAERSVALPMNWNTGSPIDVLVTGTEVMCSNSRSASIIMPRTGSPYRKHGRTFVISSREIKHTFHKGCPS